MLSTSDFHYDLPPEKIAQHPVEPRDSARLLVLHRDTDAIEHRVFRDIIQYLRPGDILVANDSRVVPARLYGRKRETGGRVELLLLEPTGDQRWLVLAGGKRLKEGTEIDIVNGAGDAAGPTARITAVLEGAQREVTFANSIDEWLDELGHTPLPPYIHEPLDDPERYQTVYARHDGSAAAPTAGLHFTADLLFALRAKGVLFETCTLHIGLDTFQPVTAAAPEEHHIHSEWATLSPEAARRINEAKLAGGRIVAVGTTSARVLETAALRSAGRTGSLQQISALDASGAGDDFCPWKPVAAFRGPTDLFIYPGYRYRAVDAMITNFHLPESSLVMMVSALVGRERLLDAYAQAMDAGYRFFSFGDGMLIL